MGIVNSVSRSSSSPQAGPATQTQSEPVKKEVVDALFGSRKFADSARGTLHELLGFGSNRVERRMEFDRKIDDHGQPGAPEEKQLARKALEAAGTKYNFSPKPISNEAKNHIVEQLLANHSVIRLAISQLRQAELHSQQASYPKPPQSDNYWGHTLLRTFLASARQKAGDTNTAPALTTVPPAAPSPQSGQRTGTSFFPPQQTPNGFKYRAGQTPEEAKTVANAYAVPPRDANEVPSTSHTPAERAARMREVVRGEIKAMHKYNAKDVIEMPQIEFMPQMGVPKGACFGLSKMMAVADSQGKGEGLKDALYRAAKDPNAEESQALLKTVKMLQSLQGTRLKSEIIGPGAANRAEETQIASVMAK